MGLLVQRFDHGTSIGPRGGAESKFEGSIPDGVIRIFYWRNPSGRTMALRSIQPLMKWIPGIFPEDKRGRCVGLIPLPPSCAEYLEIWEPQPPGILLPCSRPEQGSLYLYSEWPDVSTKCTLICVRAARLR